MIENSFEVIRSNEDPEDYKAELKCKTCQHSFPVRLNILKPNNCSYDLGRCVTVTCPACSHSDSTTIKEGKVAAVSLVAKKLKEKIEKNFSEQDVKFKVDDVPDYNSSTVKLRCASCNHTFEVPKTMSVTCPECGVNDTIDQSNIKQRLELVQLIAQYIDALNLLETVQKES